jgi:AcrR family transcriptional regulator
VAVTANRARGRRLAPELRLEALADAAEALLTKNSFRRLQVSDVAEQMGVSVGTIYRFVESKDALLLLVVRRALEPEWLPERYPLPAAPLEEIASWLRKRLDYRDFVLLERALGARRVGDPEAELRDIAAEMFDVFDQVGPVAAVLEQSAPDFPILAKVFAEARQGLFERVHSYVESRTRVDKFRGDLDPAVAARMVIELVSWAALRREQRPMGPIPTMEAARATAVGFAVHALVPDSRT